MNKVIRLLLIILPALSARPRLNFLSHRKMRYRTAWPGRRPAADLMPHSLATAFDVALVDYTISCGLAGILRQQGWSPIIVKKRMSFVEPRPDVNAAKIEIETHLTGWTEQATILAHEVRAGGELIATGLTLGRFIAPKGKPHPDTTRLAELLGKPGLKSPPYSEEVAHFLEGAPVT